MSSGLLRLVKWMEEDEPHPATEKGIYHQIVYGKARSLLAEEQNQPTLEISCEGEPLQPFTTEHVITDAEEQQAGCDACKHVDEVIEEIRKEILEVGNRYKQQRNEEDFGSTCSELSGVLEVKRRLAEVRKKIRIRNHITKNV